MNEIRVALGANRAAVAEDHLWARPAPAGPTNLPAGARDAAPALLDTIPVAEAYTIVVPAERVVFRRVAFPAGPRARAMAALPFVLEDGLIEPPEHYEFFLLDAAPVAGAAVNVAVLERDFLAAARAALARIDRGALRWVVEGWGWPAAAAGAWQLRIDARGALLARGGPGVTRLPLAQLEAGLDLALADPAAGRPTALAFDAAGDVATGERLRAWAARHGLASNPTVLPDLWQADFAGGPWTLFEQSRSRTRQAWHALANPACWRVAAWGAAALAAVELLGLLAGWATLESRVAALQKDATEAFRSVAGAHAAVVDPLLQMRRLHRAQAHGQGQATEDDFLPLIAAVGEALPRDAGRIGEMGFEDGRLRLVVQRPKGGGVPDAPGASPSSGASGASAASGLEAVTLRLRRAGFRVDAAASPDATRWTLSVGRS